MGGVNPYIPWTAMVSHCSEISKHQQKLMAESHEFKRQETSCFESSTKKGHSSLGIQSYSQMMIGGVQSPPKRIVFGFHYHSQKVIGSPGHCKPLWEVFTSFCWPQRKQFMQFFRTHMTCDLPAPPDPPVISESVSSWWLNQPLWNIWFIWSSSWIIKPQLKVKIKHLWNHQPEKVI